MKTPLLFAAAADLIRPALTTNAPSSRGPFTG